jgi:altronate dehydratase
MTILIRYARSSASSFIQTWAVTSDDHPHQVRTLLGLLLHPNVGAALVLETDADVAAAKAGAGLSYKRLVAAAATAGRAEDLAALSPTVLRLRLRDFGAELSAAASTATSLLPPLRAMARVPCAASSLIVAQQCGGSDAFSGDCD